MDSCLVTKLGRIDLRHELVNVFTGICRTGSLLDSHFFSDVLVSATLSLVADRQV